jgi:gas vesicle protein
MKGKPKNLTNRNKDDSPSSEPSTSTLPSLGYPNTPKKLDTDLKAYIMMMVEDIKKDFINSLKEIQENTAKQVEDLKDEAQKSLKELQDNTTKQVMELNKIIQCLKGEVDTIKKTQSEATLERETL